MDYLRDAIAAIGVAAGIGASSWFVRRASRDQFDRDQVVADKQHRWAADAAEIERDSRAEEERIRHLRGLRMEAATAFLLACDDLMSVKLGRRLRGLADEIVIQGVVESAVDRAAGQLVRAGWALRLISGDEVRTATVVAVNAGVGMSAKIALSKSGQFVRAFEAARDAWIKAEREELGVDFESFGSG